MDEVSSATTTSAFTPISQSGSQGGVLEQEDFLEIMIAELANQDPFEPLDNREFLGQLTQMQNLEATTSMTTSLAQLSDSLNAITFGQQVSTGSTLIGQMITGTDVNGHDVIGVVTRVLIEDDQVIVGLEGVIGHGSQEGDPEVPSSTEMTLDQVVEVRGPVLVEITEEEAGLAGDDAAPTDETSAPSDGSESGADETDTP